MCVCIYIIYMCVILYNTNCLQDNNTMYTFTTMLRTNVAVRAPSCITLYRSVINYYRILCKYLD